MANKLEQKIKSTLKKWATRGLYAAVGLGLSAGIGFMAYRAYEGPEVSPQEQTADNRAMARLTTAADTNCDFEMRGSEFQRLYARRTGEEFPHDMTYMPLVVVVSSDKLDNTITYRRLSRGSAFLETPHHYIYMSRDTALGLAEGVPNPCSISVPDFL